MYSGYGQWNLYCNFVVCALIAGSVAFMLESISRKRGESWLRELKWATILASLLIAAFALWMNIHHDFLFPPANYRNQMHPYGYALGWPMRVASYAQMTSDFYYSQIDDTSLLAICVDYLVGLGLAMSVAFISESIIRRVAIRKLPSAT
jgi:hypothetical protein